MELKVTSIPVTEEATCQAKSSPESAVYGFWSRFWTPDTNIILN
jgi:hypothetical protein